MDEAARPVTLTFPLSLQEAAMAARALRLFPDPESLPVMDDPANLDAPGITPGAPNSRDELLASLAADPAEVVLLPPAQATAAAELTLPDYHARHFRPWRQARLQAGTVKRSSLVTEDGHVRAYAAWDSDPVRQPSGWPAATRWTGMPLKHLSAKWFRQFLHDQVESGIWAPASARSCWTSLRSVLNHARQLGVVARVPSLPKLKETLRDVSADDDEADVLPYSDAELGRLYAAFDGIVAAAVRDGTIRTRSPSKVQAAAKAITRELKTALVLGANCGPRPADLFLLEFERHVKPDGNPPALLFRAAKTGKLHHVPLADATIAHLARLRKAHVQFQKIDTFLFPHLTNPRAVDPMRSSPYRRTVQLLRRAITAIGLDEAAYQKPWHSVRKSCTTRFNAHGIAHGLGSVGKLITHGKDADVASQSYDNPLPTILKAVESIDWPAEFCEMG